MAKAPMTVSKVSETEAAKIIAHAKQQNVGLHNFPTGMFPTLAQISLASDYGQDLYYSEKTLLSHQGAKRSGKSAVASVKRESPVTVQEACEQLATYLDVYQCNARRNSPFQLITNVIQAGDSVIATLNVNGVEQRLTFRATVETLNTGKQGK
jgi:type III secretion system FlhB-like substrate exporter